MTTEPTSTNAVTVKPPAFMASNPSAWFIILEAQFHLAGISNTSTKFYHALAALPVEVVSKLYSTDLTSTDYDDLKKKILNLHEASKPEIFENFLREKPLTGKPSHFLVEMQHLAAKAGVGEDLVRHKFQQALPSNIAPIIATQKSTPLNDLGKLADELYSFSSNDVAINHVSHNRTSRSDLHVRKNKDLIPFSVDQRPKICRAHIFFADRAKSCRSWCRWPDKTKCRVVQSSHNTPCTSPHQSRDNSPMKSN